MVIFFQNVLSHNSPMGIVVGVPARLGAGTVGMLVAMVTVVIG